MGGQTETTAKLSSSGVMVPGEGGPRFKQKTGSVFPARRRLVKSLILKSIIQLFGSADHDHKAAPAAAAVASADDPRPHIAPFLKSTGAKNDGHVYPYPSKNGKN